MMSPRRLAHLQLKRRADHLAESMKNGGPWTLGQEAGRDSEKELAKRGGVAGGKGASLTPMMPMVLDKLTWTNFQIFS